jgi:membrane protein implicated in regulation of membrane protease activity
VGERERTASVFARYLVLQLPGIAAAALVLAILVRYAGLSRGLAFLLFGLWIAKELILFPIVRVGYERGGRPHGADALVGSLALVQDELAPGRVGWVRVGPERWRARLRGAPEGQPPLPRGAQVRVLEVRNLELFVERVDE